MDIATLVGLIGAFVIVVLSIDDLALFVNVPSLLIVVVGSLFVVLMRSTLAEFLGAAKVASKTFIVKIDKPTDLLNQIIELGMLARKEGMIALEGQEISNKFLAKGIGMLVDGTDPDKIKQALKTELSGTITRHKNATKLWLFFGTVAPAMGMIGTLIGLVQMLSAMDDPKAIGPAMAIALLTTMYGAIIANMVCAPIAEKLQNYSAAERNNNELIIEGIMFIQAGGNPRLLADLLSAYVAPPQRGAITAG